jgi:hypothetical protein
VSPDTDVIRRKNLIVANLIGVAVIAVVLGGFVGLVWLLA